MSGAELIQHYAEVRARLYGRRPVVERPIPRSKPMLVIQQKPLEPLPEAETPVPLNMLAPCSWRFLVALAAAKHGQSVDDILSPARVLPVAQARHEAVYLIVLHTTYSIARVARLFGRDHTTALNSLRKFPRINRNTRAEKGPPRDVLIVSQASPVEAPEPGRWQQIIEQVCAKYNLTNSELVSSRRASELVAARHEAFYRMSKETSMPIGDIGRCMGNKEHTTVQYGIQKHKAKLEAAQ